MNLQQLKYIIAVDEQHSFSRAAEVCHITQPTLSSMVQKLEHELGIQIFKRHNKTVSTTPQGVKIVEQAKNTIREANKITRYANDNSDILEGELRISVSPTVAQYIIPDFISQYKKRNPKVVLKIKDMKMANMINSLLDGTLNVAIGISGNKRPDITEIPLYKESLMLYTSDRINTTTHSFETNEPSNEFIYTMKEAVNLRESTFSFSNKNSKEQNVYESNSIDILIRLIDKTGGSTIIPQMHINYLTDKQRLNVVPINKDDKYTRRVSLYLRSSDIHSALTKSIIDTLKATIPQSLSLL